jgi:flagellar biosynthesis/type III secretory pathway M-ring protein FliF/YscJ
MPDGTGDQATAEEPEKAPAGGWLWAGLLLGALLVLLLGVRPLLRRLAPPSPTSDEPAVRLLPGPDGKELLVRIPDGRTIRIDESGRPVLLGADGAPIGAEVELPDERVTLKHIDGSVNASMLGEMSELIKNRPEDAIRVIRTWLHAN